mmetsp:Transcript_16173/g.36750  ORF Transcript_16173/g.36750 Transcript_16173/m.36750 type:complete len:203 (-) Transcript_16173:889-1497(-)
MTFHRVAEGIAGQLRHGGLASSALGLTEVTLRILEDVAMPAQCPSEKSGFCVAASVSQQEGATAIAVGVKVQVDAQPTLVLVSAEACLLGRDNRWVVDESSLPVYPVQVLATHVQTMMAEGHTIRVQHGYNVDNIVAEQFSGFMVARCQKVQQAFQHVAGRRFAWVNTSTDEDRPAPREQPRSLRFLGYEVGQSRLALCGPM